MLDSVQRTAFAARSRFMVPGSRAEWKRLLTTDSITPEALNGLKNDRSIAIAQFAMEHSKFYSDFYHGHGFTVEDLKDPAAFYELPLTTKELLRENFDSIISDELTEKNSVLSVSSGSTGQPLKMYRDLRVLARAFEWRLQNWWGLEPWMSTAVIDRHYRTKSAHWKQKLLWWPAGRIQLDTFDISDQSVRKFALAWQRSKPEFLIGYIGGVLALTRIAAEKGIFLARPKAVAVTAGPLSHAQRIEIEEYFDAPVFDHYRTTEANWIAGECQEQSGLHTFDDIKNVEIVQDGLPVLDGRDGEVVVTDFDNRVFPIIRYQLGDVASRIDGPCACGRPHSRISQVRGRTSDFLVLPSGKVILGGLTGIYAGADDYVRQFQIHQERDYSIVIRCLLTEHPDAVAVAQSRLTGLRANVGSEAVVRLEIVEAIAPKGGKFRFITSDVIGSTSTVPR